jgi:hypothetical protein
MYLTLLAGCTEQPPGLPRVTAPDPIVETQKSDAEPSEVDDEIRSLFAIPGS